MSSPTPTDLLSEPEQTPSPSVLDRELRDSSKYSELCCWGSWFSQHAALLLLPLKQLSHLISHVRPHLSQWAAPTRSHTSQSRQRSRLPAGQLVKGTGLPGGSIGPLPKPDNRSMIDSVGPHFPFPDTRSNTFERKAIE